MAASISAHDQLTIGEVASRTGVATSTLRFYEDAGLIHTERNESGHRRYRREQIRRVSFIRIAQQIGLSLADIQALMHDLPEKRTPNHDDWVDIATSWAPRIDEQIALLERLKERLTGCIGCGCLSMKVCPIINADDHLRDEGAGPRTLLR